MEMPMPDWKLSPMFKTVSAAGNNGHSPHSRQNGMEPPQRKSTHSWAMTRFQHLTVPRKKPGPTTTQTQGSQWKWRTSKTHTLAPSTSRTPTMPSRTTRVKTVLGPKRKPCSLTYGSPFWVIALVTLLIRQMGKRPMDKKGQDKQQVNKEYLS